MEKITRLVLLVMILLSSVQFAIADPYEDLLMACKQGNTAAVKTAVDAGADINKLNAEGNAPIALAAFWPEIVTYLLDKGADPNLGANTVLYAAVVYSSIDVIKILVQRGVDLEKGQTSAGQNAAAVYQGLLDAEKAKGKGANKYMIKAYEDLIAAAPPATAETKVPPLNYAVGNSGCAECVKLLLDAGAKTDIRDGENGNLIYTLASSAQEPEVRINGWKTAIPTLEKMGYVMPDWFKNLDSTRCGRPENILKLLFNRGIDINDVTSKYGFTALGRALYYKKTSIAKMLIENGADPKIASNFNSNGKLLATYYPICQAAEVGDLELMKLIVEKGADINTAAKGMALVNISGLTGGDNYTTLILALSNGKADVASYLIEKGADLTIGVEGFAYVRPGNIPANLDMKCLVRVTKKTPIYWAIEAGLNTVVEQLAEKMLWKFNPDFTIATLDTHSETKGMTKFTCDFGKSKYKPSEWASKMEYPEIEKFLMSKGM